MNKRKIFFSILTALLLVFLVSLSVSAATPAISLVVTDGSGATQTSILPEGNVFYLPAQADIRAVTLMINGDKKTLDLSVKEMTDSKGSVCYKTKLTVNGRQEEYTFYQDKKLPAVFITTEKGLPFIEASKENRDKKTSVLILDENGKTEYNGIDNELKSRGNATFGYFKKPYQLKLSTKTPLLGMDAAKTWILLANYIDQTQLRNALAFHLGDTVGVPYNIENRHVLLYIDGSFRGIYQLCEKVQIDGSRVDIHELEKDNEKANIGVELDTLPIVTVRTGTLIDNSILTSYTYSKGMTDPADITGGYLVELDNVWGATEPSRFTTSNGNTYVVKSPEFVSEAQMEYIAALFADMEEAIYAKNGVNRHGKRFTDYIDIDSFASVYVVEEMMKEWDAYQSSMFFFKDADKDGETSPIHMGPLWDFDNSLGNLDVDTYATDVGFLWAQNGKFQSYTRALAAPLMQHDEYKALVKAKFDTVYLEIQGMFEKDGWLCERADEIRDAALMDRHRWQIDDPNRWVMSAGGTRKNSVRAVHFASYGDITEAPTGSALQTALGNMRDFITRRAELLLLSIGNGTPPVPPPETTVPTSPAETTAPEVTSAETTPPETTAVSPTETTSTAPTDSPDDEKKAVSPAVYIIPLAAFTVAAALILIRRKKQ